MAATGVDNCSTRPEGEVSVSQITETLENEDNGICLVKSAGNSKANCGTLWRPVGKR